MLARTLVELIHRIFATDEVDYFSAGELSVSQGSRASIIDLFALRLACLEPSRKQSRAEPCVRKHFPPALKPCAIDSFAVWMRAHPTSSRAP